MPSKIAEKFFVAGEGFWNGSFTGVCIKAAGLRPAIASFQATFALAG